MTQTRRIALPLAAGLALFWGSPTLALVPSDPAAVSMVSAQPEQITEENAITGTMNIDFGTRTNLDTSGDLKKGSPALGAKDTYQFTFDVAKTTEFVGTVHRQPNLYTRTLSTRKQDALLTYSIDLGVRNPRDLKVKKVVGKWVGTVPIDTASGAYNLAGGSAKESPLRISVDAVGSAKAFVDNFGGKLVGKAEKKDSLAGYTFKRIVGSRTVQIVLKKTDPMRFDNVILAKGPAEVFPRSTVAGRLDYDYETGNWYTDGIRFTYNLDGTDYSDLVTGSIKWVEDPDRASNGKGYYEFNLRWNEDKHTPAAGEGAAFDSMSEEDAFFAVDDTVPCLTGRITYVDSMNAEGVPTSSKVTYNLNANKLTKQQIMNFFKLWLIAIGPTNDE